MTENNTQAAGCLSRLNAELGTRKPEVYANNEDADKALDDIERSFLFGCSPLIPTGILIINNSNYDYRPRFTKARAKLLRDSA